MKTKPIVIFGGTGHYGQHVVKSLLNKNEKVRVVSRSAEKVRNIFGDEVDIVEGDVTDPKTIRKSLNSVNGAIICLSAMNPKLIRQMEAIERDAVLGIIDEAEKSGLSRLIYFSGYEMRENLLKALNIIDFGAIKIEVENRIECSALNWTILGCAPAFDLFFTLTNKGKMTVPGGGFNPVPSVSARDVGEIAAQTVLRDDLKGQRIKVTGHKAYSFPEVARIMENVGSTRIKHIAIPFFALNVVSFLIKPFNPFVRYLYKSLKLLNNFPADLAEEVPEEHKKLLSTFDYESVTLEQEINYRFNLQKNTD